MYLLATIFQDIHIFQYFLLRYLKIKHVLNRKISQKLWHTHQGKRVSFHTRIQGRVTPVSWLKLSFLIKIGSHGKAAKMSKGAINTRRYQPSALSQIRHVLYLDFTQIIWTHGIAV
jgi:hypothetical protein